MNILLLIGVIFALSGFKPASGNIDKPQPTQGFYDPLMRGWVKKKMNTNNYISRDGIGNVEKDTYFRMLNEFSGVDEVYWKTPMGYPYPAESVEAYNPIRYTTENI